MAGSCASGADDKTHSSAERERERERDEKEGKVRPLKITMINRVDRN